MSAGPDGRRGDGGVASVPGRPRGLPGIVAVALLAAALVRIGIVSVERYGTNDFAHYYLSSELLVEGGDVYGDSLAPLYEERGFTYQEEIFAATNPPTLVALFAPLALLPPAAAYWIWALVQAAALAGALLLLRPWIAGPLGDDVWWVFAGAVAVSNAVYFHFYNAQVQLLLLVLLLGAFRLQERGRHTPALLAALAAGLLKMFPLALLPWFAWKARRRPRAWAVAGVAGAAVVAATAGLWADFFRVGTDTVRVGVVDQTMNLSLPTLVANLMLVARGWSPADPGLVWGAAGASGLLLMAGAYGACLTRDLPDRQAFSLLLATSAVAGLTGWPHYYVMAAPAFALLTVWALRRPDRTRLVGLGLAYLLVLNVVGGPGVTRFGETVHVLLNYIPLYGMLGLLAWLAARVRVQAARP